MFGQPLPDRPSLLRAQVERQVLGPGQLRPDGRAALLGDDGKHAGHAFADRLDLDELVCGAARDLGDAERRELLLEVLELFFFIPGFYFRFLFEVSFFIERERERALFFKNGRGGEERGCEGQGRARAREGGTVEVVFSFRRAKRAKAKREARAESDRE